MTTANDNLIDHYNGKREAKISELDLAGRIIRELVSESNGQINLQFLLILSAVIEISHFEPEMVRIANMLCLSGPALFIYIESNRRVKDLNKRLEVFLKNTEVSVRTS